MKITKIKWKDACGDDGWLSLDKVKEETLVEIETVGYLVKKTKEFVTLTMAIEDENAGAYMVIPKKMIVSREILEANVGML